MSGFNEEALKREYEWEIFSLRRSLDDARMENECKTEGFQREISNLQSYNSELEAENQQLKCLNNELEDVLVNSVTVFYKEIHLKCSDVLGAVMKDYPLLDWQR